MEKRFTFVLIFILALGIVFCSGCTGTSYKTYNNSYMSFQYPANWKIQETADGVAIEESSSISSDYFTVTPYSSLLNNLGDYNQEIIEWTSGYIPGRDSKVIKTGKIDGISYTLIDAPKWKKYFFMKNGKGVMITGRVKDTAILENVIRTFN